MSLYKYIIIIIIIIVYNVHLYFTTVVSYNVYVICIHS